jgi:radical SAM protein with 4Fe4S-binding SPASM domain
MAGEQRMRKTVALSKDLLLVKGAHKHCIYDLAGGKLYRVSAAAGAVAEKHARGAVLDAEEEAVRDELAAAGILGPAGQGPVRKRTGPAAQPSFAWLVITDRCNLRCLHCYEDAKAAGGRDMSFADFERAVAEVQAAGIRKAQLIGGEPMAHPDFRRMVEHAARRFKFLEVFTNGTLIDAAWCEFFKTHGVHIAVSVYSYDAAEHDKVTKGAGSHARTTTAVALLKEHGVPCRTACIRMAGIALGEKNTDAYNLDEGSDVVRLTGRGNLGLLDAALVKQRLTTKEMFRWPLVRKTVERALARHNCFGRDVCISPTLEVYPCIMERRISHGNLRETGLKALMKRELCGLNKDKVEGCRDCEFRYACHDCRPDALDGDLTAKPWYCTYDPYSGEWEDADAAVQRILG